MRGRIRGQRQHPPEQRLELRVGGRRSAAHGGGGELPIGERAPEQREKIRGVGQRRGRVDTRVPGPAMLLQQRRVLPAASGGDDEAEFARAVELDAQLDRRRVRGRRVVRVELDAQAGEQRSQLGRAGVSHPAAGPDESPRSVPIR